MSINATRRLTLATAVSATPSELIRCSAGEYKWSVYGTWDGATAQLQSSPDGGATWIDIDGAIATVNGGAYGFQLGDEHVRVSVSGAGGSTSLSAVLMGVN